MTTHLRELSINPADEHIGFGPLAIRFLITGTDSTSSVAAFELTVAAGQRLPAPAHSHDHYEETIYGLDGVLTWAGDRSGTGTGAVHPARCDSPVRQPGES